MKLQKLVHILIPIACIGLLPQAPAISPPPDGGYPGGNTAEGQNALFSLTTGGYNTGVGFFSLRSNTVGTLNTAIGAGALLANAGAGNGEGSQNTATGAGALLSNTTGALNTADGTFALFHNTIGIGNAAIGYGALGSNTGGSSNIAIGSQALVSNTNGIYNTAIGPQALSFSTGNSNIAINGGRELTTGSDNIDIGNDGVAGESGTIRIGADNAQSSTFIAAIRGVGTLHPDAIPVLIDSDGQLGTASSSKRFKKEIRRMDATSEAILALKPVTFHYKTDKTGTPQFGLIAEEVASVNPDLVVRDNKGDIYTVRYDAVNAMLLNEFLKEHRKVEQLTQDFESKLGQQQKQIETLTAGVQKVSAQLEATKPTPQVVNNP